MVHWQTWKGKADPLSDIPCYPSIGNHEANCYYHTWNGAGPLQAAFPGLPQNGPAGFAGVAYAVRHANSIFLIIDTDVYNNESNVNLTQRNWVKAVLDTTTAVHKFVMGHEEAFPPNNGSSRSLEDYPGARDSLWSIMTSHHVDAYICGHIHLWNQDFFMASGHGNRPANYSVRQVINGSCGAGLTSSYGGYFYHYLVWDINGAAVAARVYDQNNVLKDSIIYTSPTGVAGRPAAAAATAPRRVYYAGGAIRWDGALDRAAVSVYDIAGRKVWSAEASGGGVSWMGAANGVYVVKVAPRDGTRPLIGKAVVAR